MFFASSRAPDVSRTVRDALGALTGQWYAMPAAPLDVVADSPVIHHQPRVAAVPNGFWSEAARRRMPPKAASICAKKRFWRRAKRGFVVAACDNSFSLYINGQKAAFGKDWTKPEVVKRREVPAKGTNTFAVHAVMILGRLKRKRTSPLPTRDPTRPFFLQRACGTLRFPTRWPGETVDLMTDSSWFGRRTW